MAISKKDQFTKADNDLAKLAKALGHPARIAILKELVKRKKCICNDLVDVLPLAQATVSQHLKALKEAEIIIGELDPPRICYCINPKTWNKLSALFGKFFNKPCC